MQRQLAASTGPGLRFVPSKRPPAYEPQSPRRNRLIAMLSEADYERLLPDFEFFPLVRGTKIYSCGDEQPHLYFIASGIVVRLYETEAGASAGFAITGSEGAVGIASYLGGKSMLNQTLVVEAGYSYRMKAEVVSREIARGSSLFTGLLRHVQATITHLTLDIACNRHHAIEQQLCRWLLECLDRTAKSEFTMTQELMSQVLGVRREGITVAAGHLRSAGVIDYSRGRLFIRDRATLEAHACECYEASKHGCERLLPGGTMHARLPEGRVA